MFSRYEPPVGVPHVLFCDILKHLQTLMLTYVDAMLMLIHPNALHTRISIVALYQFRHFNQTNALKLFPLSVLVSVIQHEKSFHEISILIINNMIGILIVPTNTCENCKWSNECQKLPFKIVLFLGLHSLFGRSLHKGDKRSGMEIDSISTYIS